MNPLDLIEAIGEMDDEWIRLCMDDQTESAAEPEHKVICDDPLPAEQIVAEEEPPITKRSSGSAIWSYLMTAGCTAACICGMALLIRFAGMNDDFSIQTSMLDSAFTEILPAATTNESVTTIVSDTGTVSGTTPLTVTTKKHPSATTVSAGTTATVTGTAGQTTTEQTNTATDDHSDRNIRTSRTTTTRPSRTTTTRTNTTARTTRTERTTTRLTSTTPAETTVTTPIIVPDILLRYCQTLRNGLPLWSDYRSLSYHDGLEYMSLSAQSGDENDPQPRVPNDTPFLLTGMYVEIGCAQGAPGDTVTVPVYIAGVPDLIGGVMFIDPPEGLEPVAITSTLDEDFDLWHPTPEQSEGDEEAYCPYITYLAKGSFVFGVTDNIHPRDGYILAYYSYRIPENAQHGTVYPVCLNAAKTEFTAALGEPDYDFDHDGVLNEEEYLAAVLGLSPSTGSYQYTLYSGVVVVE